MNFSTVWHRKFSVHHPWVRVPSITATFITTSSITRLSSPPLFITSLFITILFITAFHHPPFITSVHHHYFLWHNCFVYPNLLLFFPNFSEDPNIFGDPIISFSSQILKTTTIRSLLLTEPEKLGRKGANLGSKKCYRIVEVYSQYISIS